MEHSELEKKLSNLSSIAKKELGIKLTVQSYDPSMISLIEEKLSLADVYIEKNKVTVFNPQNYEKIYKLTKRYEKETGDKWTLLKLYSS